MYMMDDAKQNTPMEIGKDWFCYKADFDCKEPHIILAHKDGGEEKKMVVPEQLAYYLRTHWCGSKTMHDTIERNAKSSVQRDLQKILGVR
jgi:hypothetical protein